MPSLPRPDLSVGGLTGRYRALWTADLLAFGVAVDNLGDGDANASVMAVSLESSSGKSILFSSVLVPPVPAGGSANVNASLDTSTIPSGEYTVEVVLDQPDSVAESDETNNGLAWNLTVLGKAAAPGLMVAGVSVKGVLEDGRTVTIVADVVNTGDANLTGVLVEFFIDGKAANTRMLEPVVGHGNRSCSIGWAAAAGRHTVKVALSVNGGYGVSGQLPVTVQYGSADNAGQAWIFALGTALMLVALAAIVIILPRALRQRAGRPPRTEGE
jgi:hypothetical protein